MNSNESISGSLNLGNCGESSVIWPAEKVEELTGLKSQLIHSPLPTDDLQRHWPNMTLAIEQLCWEPTEKPGEGLKPTIEHFEQLLGDANS